MKQEKEIIAKITPPRVSGLIPRERLFNLIDTGNKKPALWISAHGGSGKTTLVNSYIHSRKLSSLWYQCGSEDSNPATFFYYMGLAGKKAAPRKKNLPLFTPEYLAGIPTFTTRYFEALYSRLPSPSCVVLDNYQEIPDESPLHSIISIALTCVPEGITVIIVSRNDPHKPFDSVRANDHFHYIGFEDLRFNRKEIKEFISSRKRKKLSSELETLIINKTDGWAAGMVLLLEQTALPDFTFDQIRSISFDDIFDYFSTEVFNRLTQKEQDLLSKTVYMHNIIPGLAHALTRIRKVEDILSSLYQRNFFVTKHAHINSFYQIHPLFHEFLQNHAEKTFSTEEIVSLKKSTATLLAKANYLEQATDLFIAAQDWENLVPLILQQAPLLLTQGRMSPLEKWISEIPDQIMIKIPWLVFWLGQSHLALNPAASHQKFEQAFTLFQSQNDSAGAFMAASGAVNSIILMFGNFKKIEIWRVRLEKLIKKEKGVPEGEIGEAVTASMFSILVFTKPWHPDFVTWEDRAKKTLQTPGNLHIRIQLMFALSNYYNFRGDYPEAKLILEQGHRILNSVPHSPFLDFQFKIVEGPHYRVNGEFDKAIEITKQALEVSQKIGLRIIDFMLLGQACWANLDKGDPSAAGIYLKKMECHLEKRPPVDIAFYHLQMSIKARLDRNIALANVHSAFSKKAIEESHFYIAIFLGCLQDALLSYELNKPKEAERHLKEAKKIGTLDNNPYAIFSCHLMKAHFMFTQKKEKEGTRELKRAMSIGAAHNFKTYFPLYSDVITGLCIIALEKGIEEGYVRSFIKNLNLEPKTPPLHIENWPWPVKLYTLGRCVLFKDGKPLESIRKEQKKPLEMLFAIVSLGGRKVQSSSISDLLWPEADGDIAQTSLHTTLFRLRKLLGREDALIVEHGTITLNEKLCWVDLWAFHRLLGEAGKQKLKGEDKKAHNLIQKAIQKYKGAFLENRVDLFWLAPCREKARTIFLKNISLLADQSSARKKWHIAADCYFRALEEDDLSENFYEGLMTCYKNLKDRTGFIRTYTRCKETLRSKLNIEPCQEIQSLHNSVIKK